METKNRLLFLDQFRGLAILLMVFANALAHYERVPPYLQHAAGRRLYAAGHCHADVLVRHGLRGAAFFPVAGQPRRRRQDDLPSPIRRCAS